MKQGKIIVVSAPSGCGKSTIINALLGSGDFNMRFSVSATNRLPREGEEDGVHYHFLTTEQFRDAIAADEFVEWEEVYPGRYYGTLKRELQKSIERGENIILDIDVKGALNVKKLFGVQARTIFIMPPSVAELRNRLEKRGTDSKEVIDQRVSKAEYEISFAPQFDVQVTNDELPIAIAETESAITTFLNA
jgi:guanylate kinase